MTPDKIYIPGKWLHVPSNHFETEPSYDCTEYIRKDALVEWARENFETCKTIGTRAMQKAFEELIDRIKSL